MSLSTTFITIYIDLELKNPELKNTTESRFKNFEHLASTGVPICICVSPQHVDRLKEVSEKFPNVRLHKVIHIEDIWLSQFVDKNKMTLPNTSNPVKDTHNYMILQNSKIEIVKEIMDTNPFQTPQFAWIDFSIFHVFKKIEETKLQIIEVSTCSLKENKIYIPGCCPKITSLPRLLENIQWRFCGGFFIGTKHAIEDFFDLYQENIPLFLKSYNKIIWEVNFWAYLETFCNWQPVWYLADHNDTILNIPSTFLHTQSADIYYLSFPHSERDVRMQKRFRELQMGATRANGYVGDYTIGHLQMIQKFLKESKKNFCIFMEDDVYISKDLTKQMNNLTEKMMELDLDVLLIGYLLTHSARNCHWIPQIDTMGSYTFHSYTDDLWGAQGYILTRAHAMYIVQKYTLDYLELTKKYPTLTCWSPDFIITKKGKRALVSPMLCVEEGNIRGDHPGQLALHQGTTNFNYNPETFV